MSPDTSSSSGEEDGDAAWKAAIDSIVTVDLPSSPSKRRSRKSGSSNRDDISDVDDERQKSPRTERRPPTLYQLKAQKLLDEILDKRLMIVKDPENVNGNQPTIDDGVRLFTKSSRGIVFDPNDRHQQHRERPRIIPGEEFDEKSKQFRRRMRSTSVDGNSIQAHARSACEKAQARFEARDAARKAAILGEEERVAELKKLRGEKWLPSLSREIQGKTGKPETTLAKNRSKV